MSGAGVIVRKSAFTLEVVDGEVAESYPVAIGANPDGGDKQSEGDRRTPEGSFRIVSIEDSSDWTRDGKLAYGPYFLRLECPPWKGIGIHGTDEPETVGSKATLGCIRMRNEDLEQLVAKVEVGTTVDVLP